MPTLYDIRTNEFQGQLDQIGGGTITDARVASATLGSLNAEILMDLNGKAVAVFDVRTAAMNATLQFQVSVDGTNFVPMPGINIVTEAALMSVVITTTHAAIYVVGCSGYRRVKCIVTAYTSGNVVVTGRASISDFAIYSKPMPTLLWGTTTAAAGTAITLTLAAGGAGLFHYLTHIDIRRATNTAEAAVAPLVITTTNLPGSPAWTVGAVVALGGQTDDVWIDFSQPLKSSVANTATTIVCPDPGTNAIWRINAGYYLGA